VPYFRRNCFRLTYTGGETGSIYRFLIILILGRVPVNFIKAFLKDESGATMIEYGLVAALVSVAAILALKALGTELQVIFNTVSSYLASASGGT